MRLRWFLGMVSLLLFVAATTVVLSDRLDEGGSAGDQVVGGSGTTPSTTTLPPRSGQARVTGVVTALHLEGAMLDPRTIDVPLTITSDRGFGNGGELTEVTVDGTAATVVWDGGRPFVLSSGGGLVLDPLTVDLSADELRLALGGVVCSLVPGAYQLDTPVAVGGTGVAEARDSVRFTATGASRFTGAGDAAVTLGPGAPRRLLGPGTVHLEGRLEVGDGASTRPVGTVDAAEGPFALTLTPGASGWTVSAVLAGESTAA